MMNLRSLKPSNGHYNQSVIIEFDPNKNASNCTKHGVSLEEAAQFDFANAVVWEDTRKQYPETRWLAIGNLKGRKYVLCFCDGVKGIRAISLRPANQREIAKYVQPNAP